MKPDDNLERRRERPHRLALQQRQRQPLKTSMPASVTMKDGIPKKADPVALRRADRGTHQQTAMKATG